jgi:hypothetical protein
MAVEKKTDNCYDNLYTDVMCSIKKGHNILLHAPAGNGKCLKAGTQVLMYNGDVKVCENIIKGDLVMGDDSKSRSVLEIFSGMDYMYEISTDRDDSYVVNSNHILTLHMNPKYELIEYTNWMRRKVIKYKLSYGNSNGDILYENYNSLSTVLDRLSKLEKTIDIPIKKCLNKDSEWYKYYKGLYTQIEFKSQRVDINPYVMGLWIGGGNIDKPVLYNVPADVQLWFSKTNHQYLLTTADNIEYKILTKTSKPSLCEIFEDYGGKYTYRYIPPIYLINSRNCRLKLLAGIIDMMGYVHISNYTELQNFRIETYTITLMKDIVYLTKSLGYIVKVTTKIVDRPMYVIDINGESVMDIPVKCNKNIITRSQYRQEITTTTNTNLQTEIKIKYHGFGMYYGFEVDHNNRFVLGNFIVTHNSHLIKDVYNKLKNTTVMNLTSTTGVSAFNIGNGCRTINSFSGVMIGDKDNDHYIRRIMRNKKQKDEINNCRILFIDEISMLGDDLFEKIDIILRVIRRDTRPFGGVHLIVSGDFLQIPPVKSNFCFFSDIWSKLDFEHYMLSKPQRHKNDISFYRMLMRIRRGKTLPKDLKRLHERHRLYYEMTEKERDDLGAVILYATNNNVYNYNMANLNEIKNTEYIYKSVFLGKKKTESMIEDEITLKVGAQVMLIVNLNVLTGLVNGATGKVISCSLENVTVEFVNGITTIIEKHEYVLDEENGIRVVQIPLRLAWAVSIHKSQSCTLDRVVIDLGKCFADGQAYVALSRARSLDGVYLIDFDSKSIKTNIDALEFEVGILNKK